MLEIPQNSRVIVQEDSVTADSRIIIERNGNLERTTVGELIKQLFSKYGFIDFEGRRILASNPENIKVFSINKKGETTLSKVSQFSEHFVNKKIYEIETRTGRKIKVTQDHSLFGWSDTALFESIKPTNLSIGDKIVVPKKVSWPEQEINEINLLDYFEEGFVVGKEISEFIDKNKEKIRVSFNNKTEAKNFISSSKRRNVLPLKMFIRLLKESSFKPYSFLIKCDKDSKPIPSKLKISSDLLKFFGLWLADGSYDTKYGVVISSPEKECVETINSVGNSLGLIPRRHSDGVSTIISNTTLVALMKKLGFVGNAYTKRLPQLAYSLSKEQLGCVINGIFSGDGCVSDKELSISLCSEELVRDIQSILLFFDITMRIGAKRETDKTFPCYIGHYKNLKPFNDYIGLLPEKKISRLRTLISHPPTHDIRDTIPLPSTYKEELYKFDTFNKYDYVTRNNSVGREKLKQILQQEQFEDVLFYEKLHSLAFGDIYWDEIKNIKVISNEPTEVYDFSVPGNENFVCENILAHNTLELPVPYMREIGFNIQRLKTRSPISVSKTDSEVDPAEALRTALRLGDSALILGEVRSKEAKVLYEAMRVGAAGNVVMGTIHADSAYSVWDRVVNDLGVPTTSFKATDLVVVARPIRFKGSLKKVRRVVEITEIKKHWNLDPSTEGGLLDLMKYDAAKDTLELMEDNLKESELFQKIQKVSGLTVDNIWSEIRLRGNAKLFLVEQKNSLDLKSLLEAEHTILATNKLFLMKEEMIEEDGKVNYDQLLGQWKNWVSTTLIPKLQKAKGTVKKEED
jgi:intein/homing endonuclease